MKSHMFSRKSVLAQAISIALFSANGVNAVEKEQKKDADTDVEVIEVKGFKRSLVTSIALKQNSTNFVETVSAEDIGKLPDVSIAESLSRLPGLAGQRVNGRAQVISIRGMGPDFTTTTLNGRQQASSGDNRAPEFDQYPSELLNGATVYKTADAAVVGMGLSGTVDLQTIRPLAHGEQTIAINLRGEQNSLNAVNSDVSNNGVRASISYIDQFFDDTLGLAIGYSHTDSPANLRRSKAWWWEPQSDAVAGDEHPDALVLQGQEVVGVSRQQIRDGLLAVVEWRPNSDLTAVLDTYYSKFDQVEHSRGVYWFSAGATGSEYLNPTFTEFGGTTVLQSGTATNIDPILRNDLNTRDDELFSIGLNIKANVGKWILSSDVSHSTSERTEQVSETYSGLPIQDNIEFHINQEGYPEYNTGMDYTDVNTIELSDPAPWGGWGHDGTIRYPAVEEQVSAISFDADLDLIDSSIGYIFSSAVFGIDFTQREKQKEVSEFDLMLKYDRARTTIDPSLQVSPVDLSFAGIPGILSYDTGAVIANYYDVSPILDDNHWNKAWSVDEAIVTIFSKLVIDTELLGMELTGDLGVQYITTEQSATGYSISGTNNDTAPTLNERSASYTDTLPSINLKLEVADSQYVRFAGGKYMARPRMDDLRASTSAGVSVDGIWSGWGGNPELEPWRATAFDIAYEYYFSASSYVGLVYFNKNLESYIYGDSNEFDFTGLPNDSGFAPISNIGQMSQPSNGEGGDVTGTEFSFVLDAELINESLSGLGVVGSYSWTDSTIAPDGPGTETMLPGLSEKVSNITVYYERDGFSFRVSQRYRSDFRGEVPQLFATRGFTEIQADEQVDAQIGYQFEEGALEGLTLLFQVNNLTNSPYTTKLGTSLESGAQLPEFYEEYGSQYLFGMNYKF